MPTLTINQKSITVPDGTTIIQAADKLDIEIPRYCYHPGLSIAGSCRMCLVEVERIPKLQPACNTRVSEGMVVHTNTEKVKEAVSGVLEFLLINHPLDCPVCDQAGECYLQEYYMKFGLYESRMDENKIKRHKAEVIGPHVILDTERCILCSRCVRFVNEVSHSHEIGIFNRGSQSEIGLLPGKVLDNNYSGNVVDICPVGALTDRGFRFQCRVWYLSETNSICPGCSRGCNISIHSNRQRPHHAEGRRVVRLKPRFNAEVNHWWICDEGRYGYKFIDDPSRISLARVKEKGEFLVLTLDQAIGRAGQKLKEALERAGRDSVVVIASPQLANEDLFVIRKFWGEDLGLSQIDFRIPNQNPARGDDFLLRADRNPNTRGAEAILLDENGFDLTQLLRREDSRKFQLLCLFGQDLTKKLGVPWAEKFLQQFEYVIYVGSNENETSALSHLILPSATYAETEGTFTNFEGRVQKIDQAVEPLGDSLPTWETVSKLARALGYGYDYDNAEEIFGELAERVVEFQNLAYEKIGDSGVEITDVSKMQVK
ncbi:MAG: NADH-quinone oxidoreductase subunit G [Acidobacteria bacterium]|nr:MAG: NADH-quinone oxidoreductase subunit G [Acidobacteriota bacterium]